jgi:1-acyl-sn-glycerol-3-phosphate acyltransferase
MGTASRRAISIPGVIGAAVALTLLLPLWAPVAVIADLVRARWRLPVLRLGLFGIGWAWLETAGVAAAGGLWATGRRNDHAAHYRLQRWWAANLLRVLRITTRIDVAITGVEALSPGPAVMLFRHASLADALLSAWVVTGPAGMHPRYVLKRELLSDPCLDVVGNRLPNHFVDRDAADSAAELAAITELSRGMGAGEIAVIFPEGTRASPAKRVRALERIAERDPTRLARVQTLRHLLPVRPAGSAALIAGCPEADLVLAWHVGFDGLDTFGHILARLARPPRAVQFAARRIARRDVPDDPAAFAAWLDGQWQRVDDDVNALLAAPPSPVSEHPS